VLDHHRLAEPARHEIAGDTRRDVADAARRDGHDDPDRPRRVVVRRGRSCGGNSRHKGDRDRLAPPHRYFAMMAAASISTSMPGQARWVMLRNVCAGIGMEPKASARRLPQSGWKRM